MSSRRKLANKVVDMFTDWMSKDKAAQQEGVKRYATEVHVTEMTFLSTKKSLEKPATQISQENQTTASESKKSITPEVNDDLPF